MDRSHDDLALTLTKIQSEASSSQNLIDEQIGSIKTVQLKYLERIENNEKGRIKNADDLIEIREWIKIKH